ncbi:hypothetical protein TIFTF001_032260 [Ficus carica]|uniref:Uncharacterized protein n=1 Tax=Ficus carica TaxID=3494 RepID=A0AA88DW36_FICCA|nr:hypothetical protein TIFTF001_032260 [Ficus carica]
MGNGKGMKMVWGYGDREEKVFPNPFLPSAIPRWISS